MGLAQHLQRLTLSHAASNLRPSVRFGPEILFNSTLQAAGSLFDKKIETIN